MEQSSGIALGLVLLALAGCSGGGESPEVGSAAPGGATEALICGLPVVQAPLSPPVDACRDGAVVFGPQRVTRAQGAPATEHLTFTLADGLPSCVAVTSSGDDGRHRVAAASIWIDGELVVDPGRFNQNVTTVEQLLQLAAGLHTLSIEVASPPGTFLDVSIKAGGSTQRHGLVASAHLELFNLYAEPATFSPARAASIFSAQGTVLRFEGLPSEQQSFAVRWAFEVRSASSCALVRNLRGEAVVGTPSSFAATAVWDGNDEGGAAVTDGVYVYRLVAQLVATGPGGERVVDSLSTAVQPLLLDLTPPEVQIALPADGDALNTQLVDVEIPWRDPVVNGFASGLDLLSGQVSLDGADVSGLLTLDATGARGTLDLSSQPDGAHMLVASIADLVGNVGTAASSFIVDTVPPVVTWTLPPEATDAAAVPLAFDLADETSGLALSTLELTANGMLITAAVQCTPSGPDGMLAAACNGAYALEEGDWAIAARVFDRAGNEAFAVTEVLVDRSGPQIVLDPDIEGLVTAATTVAVVGRLNDLLPVTLSVQGESIPVEGGAFSTQVTLADGWNVITLVATDTLGHGTSRSVSVLYETNAPDVTLFALNGSADLDCCAPGTGSCPVVVVDTTTSPVISANYQDGGARVNRGGIELTVDGKRQGCDPREEDQGIYQDHLRCSLDLTGGTHAVVISVPDGTGNVRACAVTATLDTEPYFAASTSGLAPYRVEIPKAYVKPVTTVRFVVQASPTVGETLTDAKIRFVGPVVDIEIAPPLPEGTVVTVTLPYDPGALVLEDTNDLSEELVRAHWKDGDHWMLEETKQWFVDTIENTVRYHTPHLSVRGATTTTLLPVTASAPAAVIDNGGPGAGDHRVLLVDPESLALMPLGISLLRAELPSDAIAAVFPTDTIVQYIGAAYRAALEAAVASYLARNSRAIRARAQVTTGHVKNVRAATHGDVAIHYRTVWTLSALPVTGLDADLAAAGLSAAKRALILGVLPLIDFTFDLDEILIRDTLGVKKGLIKLAGPDATTRACPETLQVGKTCDVDTRTHVQQTIRDFAFSPDGQHLYLVGDTSFGNRISAGDGVYMLDTTGVSVHALMPPRA